MRVDPDRIAGKHKSSTYQNSDWLARALCMMNNGLEALEHEYVCQIDKQPETPIVLISFLPRSGSTFLYQLLARTGDFNYISNFQARFWRSPCIGRIIENSVSPRRYDAIELRSDFGNTQGFSSPHEFNYFWEEHLGIDGINKSEIAVSEFTEEMQGRLMKEISGLISFEDKPLLFKREYLVLNLSILKNILKNVIIINLERNFDDIIASQLKAIEKINAGNDQELFGSVLEAFEYDKSQTLDVNVRKQTQTLKDRLEYEISKSQFPVITVQYENLCHDSDYEITRIQNWISDTRLH